MNKQAKDFGMKQTHYTSPAGADRKLLGSFAPNKYKKQGKTSKDMNMMMYHMIKKHTEILKNHRKAFINTTRSVISNRQICR